MPIILPALVDNPQTDTNTASQVSHASLAVLKLEFSRAYQLAKKIAKRKLPLQSLFCTPDFMEHDNPGVVNPTFFPALIQIDLVSLKLAENSETDHLKFAFAVESRIRSLLTQLSIQIQGKNLLMRPFPLRLNVVLEDKRIESKMEIGLRRLSEDELKVLTEITIPK